MAKTNYSQVCIPGLHLSLGIFNRLWTLLEEACTELDLRLAGESHGSAGLGGSTFKQYSVILKQMSSLKVQFESQVSHARVLEQVAVFTHLTLSNPDSSELLKVMRRESGVARQKANQLVLQSWII